MILYKYLTTKSREKVFLLTSYIKGLRHSEEPLKMPFEVRAYFHPSEMPVTQLTPYLIMHSIANYHLPYEIAFTFVMNSANIQNQILLILLT